MAALWRYCPACYTTGRTEQRYCSHCRMPQPRLQVLPIAAETLEAAFRTGGSEAVEELVVATIAGPQALEEFLMAREEYVKRDQLDRFVNGLNWNTVPRLPRRK